MKRIASLVLGLWLAFSAVQAFAGDETAVTKKYVVACMKCFAKHGSDPASHATCDMSCSRMGTDLGLVDKDDNAYIPVDADFKPIGPKFASEAGQWVEVTGVVVKTKGVTYLKVTGPIPQKDGDGYTMKDDDAQTDQDGDKDGDK